MKKKVLCVILALLMCMMATLPAFADGEAERESDRNSVLYSFGLSHVSGSTYNMHARVVNYEGALMTVGLGVYDANDNLVSAVGAASTDELITLSKNVSLSSGTYYLRISIIGLNVSKTATKLYVV